MIDQIPLILAVIAFIMQFIGELEQNGKKFNSYHNWNMMFVFFMFWLFTDMLIRINDGTLISAIGWILIFYTSYITAFHSIKDGKQLGFWYCGNGKGSGTEWVISAIARCDWEENPTKYTNVSKWYRIILFVLGCSILIFI